MGRRTGIAWTDHTFNPWWGCARVSPGCQHCYAEAFSARVKLGAWGKNADRHFFGPDHWRDPVRWNRAAEREQRPRLVFCASMADVFEERADLDEHRARLFELIEETPWLRWQLLTKRPQLVAEMVPARWMEPDRAGIQSGWPPHVWIGTSVEDQARAEERIPHLVELPALVRFLSCEPLLEALDLSSWLGLEWMDSLRPPGAPLSFRGEGGWGLDMFEALRRQDGYGAKPRISWVIVGGESGPNRRTMPTTAAADLCAQVLAAGVPLFFKQWGGRTPSAGGDLIAPYRTGTPRQYHELPPEART